MNEDLIYKYTTKPTLPNSRLQEQSSKPKVFKVIFTGKTVFCN